jgi:hypothetical protein
LFPFTASWRQLALASAGDQLKAGSKEALLFEKRSKNFCSLGYALDPRRTPNRKSFLVLFFKKELLACTFREEARP